jgi:16S rRNA (cytidine1402-2'-O)-methyltransferase
MPEPPGTLYLVATPIGNLADLSPRVSQVLAEVDLILAEDTRRTLTLLSALGIHRPLESHHQHTERAHTPQKIADLLAGRSLALVSDAGVPGISDPGAHLVAAAWEHAIPVVPVPGPSAVLSALSVCGFPADAFTFAGYPPHQASDRRRFYAAHAASAIPVVIFEAPHRLPESLDEAIAQFGEDRCALIAREMTKHFEEYRRGTLAQLRGHYDEVEPRGEYTIVFEGAPPGDAPTATSANVAEATRLLAATDLPTRQAAEILAAACGLSRNAAYDLILAARKA